MWNRIRVLKAQLPHGSQVGDSSSTRGKPLQVSMLLHPDIYSWAQDMNGWAGDSTAVKPWAWDFQNVKDAILPRSKTHVEFFWHEYVLEAGIL